MAASWCREEEPVEIEVAGEPEEVEAAEEQLSRLGFLQDFAMEARGSPGAGERGGGTAQSRAPELRLRAGCAGTEASAAQPHALGLDRQAPGCPATRVRAAEGAGGWIEERVIGRGELQ